MVCIRVVRSLGEKSECLPPAVEWNRADPSLDTRRAEEEGSVGRLRCQVWIAGSNGAVGLTALSLPCERRRGLRRAVRQQC